MPQVVHKLSYAHRFRLCQEQVMVIAIYLHFFVGAAVCGEWSPITYPDGRRDFVQPHGPLPSENEHNQGLPRGHQRAASPSVRVMS
jgi:hypothetical protein